MDYSVRCASQISNYSAMIPCSEFPQVNTVLLDSSMTHTPSLSETSKSLKMNKEEVLRNLFTVGESIRCFFTFLFSLFSFQSQIADICSTKVFLQFQCTLVLTQENVGFLALGNTNSIFYTNSGSLGFWAMPREW